MIKINNFPKKQEIYLIHTKNSVSSRIFKNLYIQISPKNSLPYRILKSPLFVQFRVVFSNSFLSPIHPDNECVGIVKFDRFILFELKDNVPISVWKKDKNSEWKKSEFIGYQLISEYSLKEFNSKKKLIKKALHLHWKKVNSDLSNIHGDLTHFNILYDNNDKLYFIDRKSTGHSKIFDFFYFYAYFKQCIYKCQTLNDKHRKTIISKLENILKDTCKYDSATEFKNDALNMNLPSIHGLHNPDTLKNDFIRIFQDL